jgi:hypothetical protein
MNLTVSRARGPLLATLCCALGAAQAHEGHVHPFELERLQINPGNGSLVVNDGSIMSQGTFRISLGGTYAYSPLVLHRPDGFPFGLLVKERGTAVLFASYAITGWAEVGAQIPAVFYQTGARTAGVDPPRARDLGTPWVNGRVSVLRRATSPVNLAVELGLGLPLGSDAVLGRSSGFMYSPRVNVGFQLGEIDGAVELNALFRPEASLEGFSGSILDRVGNTWGLAAMLSTGGDGPRGEVSIRFNRYLFGPGYGVDALAGARLPISARGPEFYLAAGPGTGTLVGQPTFRVIAGLSWGAEGMASPAAAPEGLKPPMAESPAPPADAPAPEAPAAAATPADPAAAAASCVQGQPHEWAACPDLDLDGDGVANKADQCPSEAGAVELQGCATARNE